MDKDEKIIRDQFQGVIEHYHRLNPTNQIDRNYWDFLMASALSYEERRRMEGKKLEPLSCGKEWIQTRTNYFFEQLKSKRPEELVEEFME